MDPAEKSKSRDFKGQRGGKGGGETWRPQEGFTAWTKAERLERVGQTLGARNSLMWLRLMEKGEIWVASHHGGLEYQQSKQTGLYPLWRQEDVYWYFSKGETPHIHTHIVMTLLPHISASPFQDWKLLDSVLSQHLEDLAQCTTLSKNQ